MEERQQLKCREREPEADRYPHGSAVADRATDAPELPARDQAEREVGHERVEGVAGDGGEPAEDEARRDDGNGHRGRRSSLAEEALDGPEQPRDERGDAR